MPTFLIVNISGYSYLVRHDGKLGFLKIQEAFDRYEQGEDDTDEEMICNVFNKLKVDYEILPTQIINL